MADFKDGAWLEFPIVFRSHEFYNNLAINNGLKLDVLGDLLSLGHDTGKNSDK